MTLPRGESSRLQSRTTPFAPEMSPRNFCLGPRENFPHVCCTKKNKERREGPMFSFDDFGTISSFPSSTSVRRASRIASPSRTNGRQRSQNKQNLCRQSCIIFKIFVQRLKCVDLLLEHPNPHRSQDFLFVQCWAQTYQKKIINPALTKTQSHINSTTLLHKETIKKESSGFHAPPGLCFVCARLIIPICCETLASSTE